MVDPRRKGRFAFIALAALFFVPLFIAWLWYMNVDRLPPERIGAHGELVQPARPLGGFEFPTVDGQGVVSDGSLHGRWAIVHVGGADCDAVCRESLWESRQVHARLGRDSIRVQRVYLLVGAASVDDPEFFAAEHPNLVVARVARDDATLALFPSAAEGGTYLIDPLGNLMMRYPPDATPRDLLDDLKRLLRVSRVG